MDENGKLTLEVEFFIANSIEVYIAKDYSITDCVVDIISQISNKHPYIYYDFEELYKLIK